MVESLGEKPFHVRRGLNAAVYDSVFNAFARNLPVVDKPKLSKRTKKQLANKFRQLISKDRQYEEWTISHTTDQDIVPKRLERAENVLFG